jgi:hypothetical protein
MGEDQLRERLTELNELVADNETTEVMRQKLKSFERTRHFLVWLDNSTVANSGFLVCLVTCLYDPALFFTDEEYEIKYGKKVDIQRFIEDPELHIIAKCGSSDSEQLLYNETRLKCIQDLENSLSLNDIEYKDKLRFCHGDMSLRAFEAGQQKGGNYFCSTCGIHCDMTYELDHALNCKLINVQDRQDAILQGAVSRRNTRLMKAKPFQGLS